MHDVDALAVDTQHLQCEGELVAFVALAQVVQVGLGGVQRTPVGAVLLVDTEVAEEGVGVVADDEQVARLAHVAVVVAPGMRDGRLVQAKRGIDRRVGVPAGVQFALVRSGDSLRGVRVASHAVLPLGPLLVARSAREQ